MPYLVIGQRQRRQPVVRALRASAGRSEAVETAPDRAVPRLRETWDGIILIDDRGGPGDLTSRLLRTAAPLLLADPLALSALVPDHLLALDPPRRATITVGCDGPRSAGVAALRLELGSLDTAPAARVMSLDLQVPAGSGAGPPGDALLGAALLDGALTLCELGAWPTRVAAVATAVEPVPGIGAQTTGLIATFLEPAAATAGLTLMRTPGVATRRLRVATPTASLLLREDTSGARMELDAGPEPLAAAAGAESVRWAGGHSHSVPFTDPTAASVTRFLRRRAEGGADDVALLVNGLTLLTALHRSVRRNGQPEIVSYPGATRPAPRLQLLPGGRQGPPQPAAGRAALTIVR